MLTVANREFEHHLLKSDEDALIMHWISTRAK